MTFSPLCGVNCTSRPSASTINTFLTKAQHDVTLTDTDTRIFIKNIKTGVTMEQFRNSLQEFGAMQVYFYEPGSNNDGWAWVGFENKEAALKVIEESEKMQEEMNEENLNEMQNEDNEEQGSNSFYAEDEDKKDEEEEVEEEEEEEEY
ncbi:RNA-binding protein, putative [Plasmodium reichenowi]|uniref:RNA-binding protein, putative n=1 Tax=Plasmodium reichenowi TaxID=5854 RepID=A0A060RWY9_PLARE|nr:conserved Plasmodium protein, unknown function [Plasmodium reichenowi]SOV81745.1 RNA-binding protein, putative [Plasmodium reichenowi]